MGIQSKKGMLVKFHVGRGEVFSISRDITIHVLILSNGGTCEERMIFV